jgi:hypothetical protein
MFSPIQLPQNQCFSVNQQQHPTQQQEVMQQQQMMQKQQTMPYPQAPLQLQVMPQQPTMPQQVMQQSQPYLYQQTNRSTPPQQSTYNHHSSHPSALTNMGTKTRTNKIYLQVNLWTTLKSPQNTPGKQ